MDDGDGFPPGQNGLEHEVEEKWAWLKWAWHIIMAEQRKVSTDYWTISRLVSSLPLSLSPCHTPPESRRGPTGG